MSENDHGSWAKPGDFVQFITILGKPTEIYRVVVGVCKINTRIEGRRYVKVAWQQPTMAGTRAVRDCCLRVLKRT